MSEDDLIYTMALTHIPKIGDITAKKLIEICGSAKAVCNESLSGLEKIDGIGKVLASSIKYRLDLDAAAAEYQFIKSNAITTHFYQSETYPSLLKQATDGPILLFSKGDINFNNTRILSIVGTRKITNRSKLFCSQLVEELAVYNPIIVSGLAYGVDITAQKAALNNNLQTIGCLAHGLNTIYPEHHKKYASEIVKHGGFVSDFWSSDSFTRNNFLKRNRIIAGISKATLVIESAEKGGSLVTADIANSYNRDVFAVPGRPSDVMSTGCNNLIKQQKAHAITSANDIVKLLNWDVDEVRQEPKQMSFFADLQPEEQIIMTVIDANTVISLDDLALQTQIPNYKVATILLQLELKGLVNPLQGKRFERA